MSEAELVQAVTKRQRRTRADAYPEGLRHDLSPCGHSECGCKDSLFECCFDCPLPRCRYEEPGGLRALMNEIRDDEIAALRRRGVEIAELAERFDVSTRTVFRVLEDSTKRRATTARLRRERVA